MIVQGGGGLFQNNISTRGVEGDYLKEAIN